MIKKQFLVGACVIAIVASMAGCSKKTENPTNNTVTETPSSESNNESVQELTYSASAKGFGGDVIVEITTDGTKITTVVAKGDLETAEIGGKAITTFNDGALKDLTGKALAEVDADAIDSVSGATVSSGAVKNALKTALKEAQGISK